MQVVKLLDAREVNNGVKQVRGKVAPLGPRARRPQTAPVLSALVALGPALVPYQAVQSPPLPAVQLLLHYCQGGRAGARGLPVGGHRLDRQVGAPALCPAPDPPALLFLSPLACTLRTPSPHAAPPARSPLCPRSRYNRLFTVNGTCTAADRADFEAQVKTVVESFTPPPPATA